MKMSFRVRIEVNDKWAGNLSNDEIQERVAATLNAGKRFPIEGIHKVKILLPTTPHSADYRR